MTRARVAVSGPVVRFAHVARRLGVAAVIVGLCWRPTHHERGVVSGADGVDVLFVVDSSSSMSDDQARLAQNFDAFFDAALAGSDVDFRAAVTTTDADGRLSPVLTPDTPLLKSSFVDAVSVGTGGDSEEKGVDAVRAVLRRSDVDFLRPGAALAVVVVSDEGDSSAGSVDDLAADLARVKGTSPVMISGVVDRGYDALVDRFHGEALSIDGAWGAQLAVLGEQTFRLARTVFLQHEAAPQTVVVRVDGVVVDVDVDDDHLVLSERDAARCGSAIDVRYNDRWPLGVTLARALPGLVWRGHVELVQWIGAL